MMNAEPLASHASRKSTPFPCPLPCKEILPKLQQCGAPCTDLVDLPALCCNTHMAADAGWGLPSRPPQYSSAHSQMTRRDRTVKWKKQQ